MTAPPLRGPSPAGRGALADALNPPLLALRGGPDGVYLVLVLEILKLRRFRLRQVLDRRRAGEPPPAETEIDVGVAHELETGSFAAVNPDTGEIESVDPDTGEFEAIGPA